MRYYTERLTYDEWVARGYHIKAGSKMVGRNAAGVAVFSASQVEANTPRPYTSRRNKGSSYLVARYSVSDVDNDEDGRDEDLFYGMPDDDLGDRG